LIFVEHTVSIHKGDKRLLIIEAYHYCQLYTKILYHIVFSKLTQSAEEIIEDHQCGFRRNMSTTVHMFCILKIIDKNGNIMKQCISYLQISRKIMIELGQRSCIISLFLISHETGKANNNVSEWNLRHSIGWQTPVWHSSY